jgi:hypothetical protein
LITPVTRWDPSPRWSVLAFSLIAAAFLAASAPCLSQEAIRFDLVMKPFESQGEADPDFTKTLWRDLARAIERKSDHRVATGGPAYYYLKGQVLADGKRHLATLQLFKAKTDRLIWMQNYDYRSVSADVMATDVIEALSFVPQTDTWN